MAATGQRGRSANRLDNDIVSQFGRNQAIMAESLLSAHVNMIHSCGRYQT